MFLVKFKKKMNPANDQIVEQQTEKKGEWAERSKNKGFEAVGIE